MSAAPSKADLVRDAALALMAERGFHGTAMPDVARAAGVGVGTIYRHFRTKEEMANAVYRRCKEGFAEAVFSAGLPEGDRQAQFHGLWRRMADFARREPAAFRFLELHHHADYLDDASRAASDNVMAPAVAFLAQAAREGVVRPLPPPLLIAVVWGALVGLVKAGWKGDFALDDHSIALAAGCAWAAIAERP